MTGSSLRGYSSGQSLAFQELDDTICPLSCRYQPAATGRRRFAVSLLPININLTFQLYIRSPLRYSVRHRTAIVIRCSARPADIRNQMPSYCPVGSDNSDFRLLHSNRCGVFDPASRDSCAIGSMQLLFPGKPVCYCCTLQIRVAASIPSMSSSLLTRYPHRQFFFQLLFPYFFISRLWILPPYLTTALPSLNLLANGVAAPADKQGDIMTSVRDGLQPGAHLGNFLSKGVFIAKPFLADIQLSRYNSIGFWFSPVLHKLLLLQTRTRSVCSFLSSWRL